jgi:addiction module HigA family antidote
MIPINRPPTTPGEILEEEFLKPPGLTQKQLADHIGYDVKVVNRIVNSKTSVTVKMAVKLATLLVQEQLRGTIDVMSGEGTRVDIGFRGIA